MDIKYNLINNNFFYKQSEKKEIEKLNFLLTNNKGDFFMQGIEKNSTKFQGFNICKQETLEIFKIIDEIIVPNLKVTKVEYGGYFVKRTLGSSLVQNEDGDEDKSILTTDKFYLGPTGGIVYEINNYDGRIYIDLDIKKIHDFDEWGREYNLYEENNTIFIEYVKKNGENEDYKLFFGIKTPNFNYEILKDWVKKIYPYSKQRNSSFERYVYRPLGIDISQSKRIILGAGFSKEEVKEQLSLLELHQEELEKYDKISYEEFIKNPDFNIPITQDISVAYSLSNNATYNFLNKELNSPKMKSGSYAGFPWFSNVWARDELLAIRALINNNENKTVKEKLISYLNNIDINSGMLKRIEEQGSLESPDGVFLLAKRFEDFIFHIEKEKKLYEIFNKDELIAIFDKFYLVFNRIIENLWDKETELIKVKYGDSWMDTIENTYPLDIQVEFLEMISFLVVIGEITNRIDVLPHLKDFEHMLKTKIQKEYFRNGYLYNEPFEDRITPNVFLAYYLYPTLFEESVWETIFDNSIRHLKTSWGGFTSISKKDSRFSPVYTGENNKSYHKGDSWYWINNLAAISMHSLNEKKYRHFISKIILSSTQDILKYGCIGYASEVSGANEQESAGSFAQLWSSTTYLEMIDNIFERE